MSEKSARGYLSDFYRQCIQCGVCLNVCDLLGDLGMTPGEIADLVCSDQVDERLLRAIQRCSLCGRCSVDCLVNLNPSHMMEAAREVLIRHGDVSPDDYDVMLVDRDWNFFTIYRDTYNIHYDDLNADQFDVLFFPGCTLSSYSPELTRAAFDWLKGRGIVLGFSDMCCGKPLESIGLHDEADRYRARLRGQMEHAGAKKLITSCPNCETTLRHSLIGVEIISIYTMLVEAGICLGGAESLTFHDPCPDRYNSRNRQEVRALFAGYPQVEMASHGENTICCGSGGIVSAIDPERCSMLARKRMEEFTQSGAATCLTSCMACAHRLARAAKPGQVQHLLEKVFDIRVDFKQVERNTHSMWEGLSGEVNISRLSQARVPDPNE